MVVEEGIIGTYIPKVGKHLKTSMITASHGRKSGAPYSQRTVT